MTAKQRLLFGIQHILAALLIAAGLRQIMETMEECQIREGK